jgi:hypothetical protein
MFAAIANGPRWFLTLYLGLDREAQINKDHTPRNGPPERTLVVRFD